MGSKPPVTRPGRLERYSPTTHSTADLLPQLATLLKRTIEDGNAMTFVPPVSYDQTSDLWSKTLADPRKVLWLYLVDRSPSAPQTPEVAATPEASYTVVGTVDLADISCGTGPFRAKIEKLIVAPEYQRLGIAEELMRALEAHATSAGLYYLTMGTEEGCPADAFYRKIGYSVEATLPEYIVSAKTGKLMGCTHFYKILEH